MRAKKQRLPRKVKKYIFKRLHAEKSEFSRYTARTFAAAISRYYLGTEWLK